VLRTLLRPAHHTLERGRRIPRKGYGRPPRARLGRQCVVGPVRHVSSVIIGPVRPSPLPCCHPRHCSTIPDAVGVRDNKTPPRLLLYALRPPVSHTLESAYGRRLSGEIPPSHAQNCSWTGTSTPRRSARSKILQDGRLVHSAIHHTTTCN
jgi:hypothetical protein